MVIPKPLLQKGVDQPTEKARDDPRQQIHSKMFIVQIHWSHSQQPTNLRIPSTCCILEISLMRDEYPSTDDDQSIQVDIPYPDVKKDLNRWMPLFKWILVIPHLIVLLLIFIAVVVCSVFAWFAILFTGQYPKRIFDFVEGFLRWSLRVIAYVFLLTTDEYPPFRLGE